MLLGVCVGTNNLEQASQFYDSVLSTLGWQRTMQNEVEVGYGLQPSQSQFWVLKPYNGSAATVGNGTQVSFPADSAESVNSFYANAIECGAKDEGLPGPRDYQPGYYGAYCRDLDGNKLHVYTLLSQ